MDTQNKTHREIKFRVWDEQTKKMWYSDGTLLPMKITFAASYVSCRGRCGYDPSANHIMQYIGLSDKNNKEAYHKDKVSALGYSNWIIEWHNNGWKLKQKGVENYQEIPDDFIIIGHIYKNPKLLGDKK